MRPWRSNWLAPQISVSDPRRKSRKILVPACRILGARSRTLICAGMAFGRRQRLSTCPDQRSPCRRAHRNHLALFENWHDIAPSPWTGLRRASPCSAARTFSSGRTSGEFQMLQLTHRCHSQRLRFDLKISPCFAWRAPVARRISLGNQTWGWGTTAKAAENPQAHRN